MQPRSKVEAYRAASTGRVDDWQDHVCPLATYKKAAFFAI